MTRIRVLDIAKELGLDTKSTIMKLQDVGVSVKNHFNSISDAEADKLRSYVRSAKTPEKQAAPKPASKVVIRRKAVDAAPEPTVEVSAAPDPVTLSQSEDATSHVEHNDETENISDVIVNKAPAEPSTPHKKHAKLSEDKVIESEPHTNASVDIEVASQADTVVVVETSSIEYPDQNTLDLINSGGSDTKSIGQTQAIPSTSGVRVIPSNTASQTSQRQNIIANPQQVAMPKQGKPPQDPANKPAYSAVIVRRDAPPPPPPPTNTAPGNGLVANSTGAGRTYTRSTNTQQGDKLSAIGNTRNTTARTDVRPQVPGGGYTTTGGGLARPSENKGAPRFTSGGGNRFEGDNDRDGFKSSSGPGGRTSTGYVMPEGFPQKEASRTRVEKDRDKRRVLEDELSGKKVPAARIKGRTDTPNIDELDDEVTMLPTGDTDEIRTVYAHVPNRKRGSAALSRRKEHKKQAIPNPTRASKKIIRIDETISVSDLASELSVKTSSIVKTLMGFGTMAGVNQSLDVDTATLVAQEYGYEVQNTAVSISDILSKKSADTTDIPEVTRPPIVTIMGHVDHGKTSLLDAIRTTTVASGEAGGITQHIGAYQAELNGRKISFLDTPGHEAFTAMRARGAQVTDLVVLVVAADDGVMPQTVEAINHAKSAGVPIIVAINKIDKPNPNLDRLNRDLAQHGITSEEWGGDSMFVKVSAKTRQGVDDLLESILLQADVLDLKARRDVPAQGVVIEAKLDKSRGAVATVIVTQGVLRVQDWIVAGTTSGRVRAMFNDKGEKLSEAPASTPVEILGLNAVPSAGDGFNCVANDGVAKEAVAYRITKHREKSALLDKKVSMEDILLKMAANDSNCKDLALIIKADTHGSTEAIKASVAKLGTGKVKPKVIHAAVGGITETDISLAHASNALVIGFNVRPDRVASMIAEREGVKICFFSIIYELIEAVEKAMIGVLDPLKIEKFLGRAEIRSLFTVPRIGTIAGSSIVDGKVTRNSLVRVIRDGTVVYTAKVSSLKRFKEDAKEVLQGFECGIGVENFNDLKIGDILESFIIEETADTLN